MTLATKLQALQGDPKTFLWSNVIAIAGNSHYGTRWISMSDASYEDVSKYRLMTVNSMPGAEQTGAQVWNVPMVKNDTSVTYSALPHTHITSTNPGLIVTGMLTGCTTAIARISATELRICHIQPGGVRPAAEETQELIRLNGQMGGVEPTHFFGPQNYHHPNQKAHFIGVAVGGAWQLWGQCVDGGSGRMITQLTRII